MKTDEWRDTEKDGEGEVKKSGKQVRQVGRSGQEAGGREGGGQGGLRG